MAIERVIKFKVSADGKVTCNGSRRPQLAGVQGENKVCRLDFDVSEIWSDAARYFLEFVLGGGTPIITTEETDEMTVDAEQKIVSFTLGNEITNEGGQVEIHLVEELLDADSNSSVEGSTYVAFIYFRSKREAILSAKKTTYGILREVNEKYDEMKSGLDKQGETIEYHTFEIGKLQNIPIVYNMSYSDDKFSIDYIINQTTRETRSCALDLTKTTDTIYLVKDMTSKDYWFIANSDDVISLDSTNFFKYAIAKVCIEDGTVVSYYSYDCRKLKDYVDTQTQATKNDYNNKINKVNNQISAINMNNVVIPIGIPENDKENKLLTLQNFVYNSVYYYISDNEYDYSACELNTPYYVHVALEEVSEEWGNATFIVSENSSESGYYKYCAFKVFDTGVSYKFYCNNAWTLGLGDRFKSMDEAKADQSQVDNIAEGLGNVQENKANIDYANNTFSNAIKGNGTGTALTFNDVSPIEHKVELSGTAGASVNVYGKNMLCFVDKTQSGYTFSGSNCKVVNPTTYYCYPTGTEFALQPGIYTFSCVVSGERTYAGKSEFRAIFKLGDVQNYIYLTKFIGGTEIYKTTFTITEQTQFTFVNVWFAETPTSADLSLDFQLELGNTATDYEPYKGTQTITLDENGKGEADSVSPNMTVVSDSDVSVEYNRDINDVLDDFDKKKANESEISDLKAYIGYTDSDILGLQVDFENKTFTRLAGAVGLNGGADFDKFSMYGNRKRCIVSGNEVVAYYEDDGFYDSTGTSYDESQYSTIMVEQPAFYYKIVPLKLEKNTDSGIGYHARKVNYYISATPKAGFKLHPAFYDENGNPVDKIYFSGYEAGLYNSETGVVFNDGTDTNKTISDNDNLCSMPNVKPISGLRKTMNKTNFEMLAQRNGSGWHLETIQAVSANQLLMMIEYATMDMQTAIGKGVVDITDNSSYNCSSLTGSTSSLGNMSGQATETINEIGGTQTTYDVAGKLSVSYRGMENCWGNLFKHVNGINIFGDGTMHGGMIFVCSDFNFNENKKDDNYKCTSLTLPNSNGYIKSIGYNDTFDWLFIPSEIGGTSVLPVGDECRVITNMNGFKMCLLSGYYNMTYSAGAFYYGFSNSVNGSFRTFNGRLIYIPSSREA